MVKLSVIVPFFNVQQYAPDTLHSLRANARSDFEFVLVDDKSTDRTPELLERSLDSLPGARLVRHERNGGLATARNTGIDAARGEYLTFLDGDDWYGPGYLPRLVAAIEDLGTDFVRVDHVQCTGRARNVIRVPHGRRGVPLKARDAILPADRSTSVDYPYAWAGIYHRRLVDAGLLHFPDGLRTAEDRPWIWRLHRKAESFGVAELFGIFYRRGVTTSLTQIGDVRQLDFIRSFDQVIAEVSQDPEADRFLPKAVRTYCAIIAHHLGNIDRFEPQVARKLKAMSAAALRRLPQDVLTDALDSMDLERSSKIRRLRWRLPADGTAAA
ncbi:glycosyltransferase family 2 protein [Actinacidiphila sp. DG2A-62]|uniref:glycosyltransferase family 2 protein n=1 Tax=Actinacidiphila sp. DG2A-62 TaxID=3108821 RepID=UPI002DBD7C20|nr:glycosyltransferase family 2 protein [Actinacidiphila sp. DG2A-62]MEC3996601.1 glycosyltransferase family 2 protein [Actinacidiphila sp. DG2A-62]